MHHSFYHFPQYIPQNKPPHPKKKRKAACECKFHCSSSQQHKIIFSILNMPHIFDQFLQHHIQHLKFAILKLVFTVITFIRWLSLLWWWKIPFQRWYDDGVTVKSGSIADTMEDPLEVIRLAIMSSTWSVNIRHTDTLVSLALPCMTCGGHHSPWAFLGTPEHILKGKLPQDPFSQSIWDLWVAT